MNELNLESRLTRLEAIARDLEGDDLELDAALALFEEAVTHLRKTEGLLEGAQLQVDELLGSLERQAIVALDGDESGSGGADEAE